MRTVTKIAYFLSLVCGIFAMLAMFSAVSGGGDNAIQQTGMIAFAVGLGIVPYCMASAVDGMTK